MARNRTPTSEILRQLAAATAQSERERKAGLYADSAVYDHRSRRVIMELTNGCLFGFPIDSIPELAVASRAQLGEVELSPGGMLLHWEELDADLSVPALLTSSIGRRQTLKELARLAGQAKSPAKAAAARTNGAKGGRPRKAASGS